jgi:hypothetical protein
MKSICIAIVALLFFDSSKSDSLTGTWMRLSPAGAPVYRVVFSADTYKTYINDKPGVNGVYTLNDSIFDINDSGCPDEPARYKITFFGNNDSCRLQVINDGCDARMHQADNAILYRVKKPIRL